MDEILNRKSDRKSVGEGIQYKRLQDEESATSESLETEEMGRYRGRCFSLIANIKASRMKSKLKYLLIPLIIFSFALWWTSYLWWPKPSPLVWSDDMRYTIYRKSNQRLVDRYVHLDLKGAPPRVEYLQKLFPLFRQWGANGVLIEWEDMFPYHDSLSIVRHGDFYDDQKLKSILKSARDAGLKIIPLVQTFGHMEWILKQPAYANVREVTRYPQVICPSNNESLALVKKIVDDIIKTHHGYIDAIHIGADEAYHVGKECTRCQKRIKELGGLDRLMLEYVSQVAKYIKDKHGLRVLMWNDMFEKTDVKILRSYSMHELVEPVIWGYAEYLFKRDYFSDGVFDRFADVFNRLWVASAFKGANWPDQPFVDLRRYALNHLAWLQVLNYYDGPLKAVGGIILTGWQRFDHFAILCELLPPALPSLVFNLQVIQQGGMSPELFDTTRQLLNCELPPPSVNWTADAPEWLQVVERFANGSEMHIKKPRAPALKTLKCDFPGSEVYALTERLRLIKHEYDAFMNTSIRRGWMHEYNIHHQYGSVHHAEACYNVSESLLHHFADLGHLLQAELSKIYYDDTVTEWLYENVQVHVDQLKTINLASIQMKQTVAFRNRPLTHMKLDL